MEYLWNINREHHKASEGLGGTRDLPYTCIEYHQSSWLRIMAIILCDESPFNREILLYPRQKKIKVNSVRANITNITGDLVLNDRVINLIGNAIRVLVWVCS